MIVIINGPCGVGKTEVSWNLVERFPEGVMLDGDHIGAVYPFEIYDQQRIAYLYQTAFQNFRMGRATAGAFVLFLIVMGVSFVVLRVLRQGGVESYE